MIARLLIALLTGAFGSLAAALAWVELTAPVEDKRRPITRM